MRSVGCWFDELIFHVNPIISLRAFVYMHIVYIYIYIISVTGSPGPAYRVKTLIIYAQRPRWLTTAPGAGDKDIRTVRWLGAPETMVNFLTRRDVKIVAVLYDTHRAPRKRYIIMYTRTDGLWTRQSYGSPVQQQRSIAGLQHAMSVVRGRAFKTVNYT